MSKPSHPRRLGDNEAKAFAKTIRVSPQKLNLVAQSIRGLSAENALAELSFSRKRIAGTVDGSAGGDRECGKQPPARR